MSQTDIIKLSDFFNNRIKSKKWEWSHEDNEVKQKDKDIVLLEYSRQTLFISTIIFDYFCKALRYEFEFLKFFLVEYMRITFDIKVNSISTVFN